MLFCWLHLGFFPPHLPWANGASSFSFLTKQQKFGWPSEPRARTAWAQKKRWLVMTSMKSVSSIKCPACEAPCPRCNLLKLHIITRRRYCTAETREEWLFNNRFNKPGDDMKDEDAGAWQHKPNGIASRGGPALVFPSEVEVLEHIFFQVRHEEGLIAVQSEGSKTRRLLLAQCSLFSVRRYHWVSAAEDGVRAGAILLRMKWEPGRVSPFHLWSGLVCLWSGFCFGPIDL